MRYELCRIAEPPLAGGWIVLSFGRDADVYRAGGSVWAVHNVGMHFGGAPERRDNGGDALVVRGE